MLFPMLSQRSSRHSSRRRTLIAPLFAAFCLGGCATLANPRPPLLRIRTDSVAATVLTARGDTLGTTPLAVRLRPRERQNLVLTAPGYDSSVVTIGWRTRPVLLSALNPLFLVVDGLTGAAWVHDPDSLDVIMTPSPVAEGPVEELSDTELALVYDEFANMAEAAGCELLLVEALRDAAYVLGSADSAAQPVPDSVQRVAEEEVERVRPEVQDLCTQPSPHVDRLRQIRESLEDTTTVVVANEPPLLAPVFFAANEWEIRDDSVRARLRALGDRLADEPASLIVEGFSDAAELRHPELRAQRAWSVIRELQAGGLARDRIVFSHGGDDPFMADAAEARLNRRVTFTLDYERPR